MRGETGEAKVMKDLNLVTPTVTMGSCKKFNHRALWARSLRITMVATIVINKTIFLRETIWLKMAWHNLKMAHLDSLRNFRTSSITSFTGMKKEVWLKKHMS